MRKIFLIALRDYIAFVRTVGFWLSLITVPAFILISGSSSYLAHHDSPALRVAVLDISGEHLGPQIEAFINKQDPHYKMAETQITLPKDRLSAAKSVSGGGIRLVTLPTELKDITTMSQADIQLKAYFKNDKADIDSLIVSALDKDVVSLHIWSKSDKKGAVEGAIGDWQFDLLQYYRLAQKNGIDPVIAKTMRDSKAQILNLTPVTNMAAKNDFAENLKTQGPRYVGIAIGYICWISIFSSSMILLQSVIEEKSSKVIEVVLASAPAESLLIGKVIAVSMVMLSVLGIWLSVILSVFGLGLLNIPSDIMLSIMSLAASIFSPGHTLLLLTYFVGGYLMYGMLFASIGAYCESQKDAQAIMGPMMMILMVPVIVMQYALVSSSVPPIRFLSYVPIFAPFLMPLRMAGKLETWEYIVTLGGMALMTWFMIRVGVRAFKQGTLNGAKLNLRHIVKLISGK